MNCFSFSVSENKVLCHPASVDSLPTSAGQEDHVSMGGFSARKALMVVENVEKVIAIELMAACQAMEFLRPLRSTKPLESVYSLVRGVVRYDIFSISSFKLADNLHLILISENGIKIVTWRQILRQSVDCCVQIKSGNKLNHA